MRAFLAFAVSAGLVSPALAWDASKFKLYGGLDLNRLDAGTVVANDAGGSSLTGILAAGACDTSKWTGYVPGTSSPVQSCYATKSSTKINIPFAASVGIGPEVFTDPLPPPGDQQYIQLAQQLVQSKTTQGNMRQESAMVINFESMTGAGPQTNHGQKVALYVPTIVRPGGGNTWAFNPALTILADTGAQSHYNTEIDMTNFNGPYQPGGRLGNAASVFRTFLGFPITAGELWSGEAPAPSTVTATVAAGSNSITFAGVPISGGGTTVLHVGDRVTGPGIPDLTIVTAIDGDTAAVNKTSGTATLNNPANGTANGVTLTRTTYNMVNGHLYQGAHLIRDNTFYDGTQAITSINVAGTHYTGFNTTQGSMPYAMTSGQGQKTCLNGLDACLYCAGNGTLRYEQNGGKVLNLIGTPGGINSIAITSAGAGGAGFISPDGPAADIPLILQGKGAGPVQVNGGAVVTGGLGLPSLPAVAGTAKGTLCVDTGGNVYVKATAGACL
ncbi:hypothetical protein [Methylobacterium sp. SyP6R]|uniref:hypothetical protein n=1 Tax=Methylobacterium sp. SyP6R TaxID=2718876 RepID=UPI001F302C84|nr:hypothetical protein [Methylobacterium sp. SyP6R]MCF4123847.1 hypothetical protein [Methylobacterium sp. SyP6R]